ncbi:MAG: PhzF family phenazine biosynthesis protein [Clostridia bacterium]|nr:PhzF family phenazine biosynthesis protein [Clostridia bacterium]
MLTCYFVDAFAERPFEGNPAAVCVLERWPEDALLQNIAIEHNLSETAYVVKTARGWHLRWFTPGGEVDLCGHATLGTAFALSRFVEPDAQEFLFETMSGDLRVQRKEDKFYMDFPAYDLKSVPVTEAMEQAIGCRPLEAWMGRDLLLVLPDAAAVENCRPDQALLAELPGLITHITAPGRDGDDCTSRSFAPKLAIAEDPVCGSGHCHIAPYWGKRLGKEEIVAWQASRRGGRLWCSLRGERVTLGGRAVAYAKSEIYL